MKRVRRYGLKDIIIRHMGYLYCTMFRKDIYNYEQQVLIEYGRCQRQRRKINHAEIGRVAREIKSKKNDSKFLISRIAVSVTNQCSLKCRDCNNLMPYCKEKFTIDIEDQIKDLEKLLYYVDGIVNVEVIGGEPFVYKQLSKLLEYLCNESKVKFVEITSNGTVVPSEEVLGLLANPKVCVLLSDYGKINAEKVRRTYKYLKQNNVCVQNLKNRKWISGGGIEKRKKSKMRMKYEYFHCFARKDCRTLYKGRLYVCGRAPVLDELELLTDDSSFFDIRGMKVPKTNGKKQLYDFFRNDYAECCDFCDISSDFSCWIESGIQA